MLLGTALAATAFVAQPVAVLLLLTVVGGSRALFEVAVRTLLQRAVASHMVGRVFGLAEGLNMAALAVGAVLAPVLIALGGDRLALAGVAALLPLVVVVQGRLLMRIDQHARVPIVEISLLRAIPLFHVLPGPSLEGLAHALVRVEYAAGAVMIREGDEGDRYYAIADGTVEITGIAREAGHRTKIAVKSNVPGVNAKGSCIGPMGQRVRAVMNELHGEKIDIIDWSDDPATLVGNALSPARVSSVTVVDEASRSARVVVPDFQLSLAIGKEGQNARLAARLTGWRVDIKSETMLADEEAGRGAYAEEDYAEGEWVENAETGELEWHPAEGGPALTADQWEHAGEEPAPGGATPPAEPAGDAPASAAEPAPAAEAAVPAGPARDEGGS